MNPWRYSFWAVVNSPGEAGLTGGVVADDIVRPFSTAGAKPRFAMNEARELIYSER